MIKKYLLTGFFTILPSIVTIWTLKAVFHALEGTFHKPTTLISNWLGFSSQSYWLLAVISGIATLTLLFAVGLLVSNFIGIKILNWFDKIAMHIPLVKNIYGATKQLMNAIQNGQDSTFTEVVIVEWPISNNYTLGFIANKNCIWTQLPSCTNLIAVYIPTAPNPTSGYIIMLDKTKIKPISIAPDEALTWIISGGIVTPKDKPQII